MSAELASVVAAPARAATDNLIAFRDVGLTIGGHEILRGINMDIRRGEFVCVVGPSGCGKTTTLRLIAGLMRPTNGSVTFAGKTVTAPRQDVAIMFQDYGKALLPWRTAAGNVALAMESLRVPKSERADRISALLAKVGLRGQEKRYPNQLSGGMQQRLQIARCLAQNPSVLLMDEPFGALDAMTRQALQDEVMGIVASTGATVFFVTHDLEEAVYLGDRVIGLLPHPGRVGQTVDVPLSRPRDQLTTRESPEFLHLRRTLFDFIKEAEIMSGISATTPVEAAAAAPLPAASRRRRLPLEGLVFPFALLLIAELLFDLSHIQSDSLSAPSAALMAGIGAFRDGSMLQATADTLISSFGGLAIGGSVGLVLGLLFGTLPVVDRLMEFTIESVRPIPSVALIPVALLVYGFGYRMEIAVVTFAATWPVLIMTRSAVAGVEPRLIEVARALRFNMLQRIWKIVLPAALPRIFVGFRLAAGVALIVAVTCEISANPLGLGYGMMMAEQSLHPDLMLAFLIWIGFVGWALNIGLVTAQNRLFGPAGVVERGR